MTSSRLFSGVVFLACLLVLQEGWAQTSCTVTPGSMAFPAYDSRQASVGTAVVNIDCTTKIASVTLSANAGTGTISDRTMTKSASTLHYNLYIDSTYTTVWGDGTTGSTISAPIGNNKKGSATIYGKIPAGQNVVPGTYTSIVTVTATF